jgi:hypothetical protein
LAKANTAGNYALISIHPLAEEEMISTVINDESTAVKIDPNDAPIIDHKLQKRTRVDIKKL